MRSLVRIERHRKTRLAAVTIAFVTAVTTLGVGVTGAAADAEGTGPQPKGLGLGSKAALAQDTCTDNGRTSFVYVGDGPFCVNPWPEGKDNGGATAPGVTATEMKVVVYIPNAAMLDAAKARGGGAPYNQGTHQPATYQEVFTDFDRVYQHAIEQSGTWQTWGRKPAFEFVTATGPDEASQRADALEVVGKAPFLVIDLADPVSGSPVFSAAVAAKKIIVVSNSTRLENATKQAPYRWSTGDPDAGTFLAASFLGAALSGKKAQWAGDSAMTSKTRSFGTVYPATGFDLDEFKEQLRKNKVSALKSAVEYDDTDPTKFEEAAPALVTKLKSAGVTSVIMFTNPAMTNALMAAATKQEYRPEWIITGSGFADFDGFARTNDQDQMAHTFGIGLLPPSHEGASSSTGIFQWYWGEDQGNFDQATQGSFSMIYEMIQYGGPTLTAANVEKGMFSVPAHSGASDGTTDFQYGFGKTVKLPYDEYGLLGSDRNLAWWNPNIRGGANAFPTLVGKGKFMYLDGAKRFAYGQFPKQVKFFDEASSVSEIPRSSDFPGGVEAAPNPCEGCPSSGGTG